MRFVLLHYHIFKNAGSTIEDILDHSFGDRFATLETPVEGGIVSNSDLIAFLDAHPNVCAFSSHQIRYPMPVAPGYLFFDICFLRDPLDRLRSFYDYFRQKPNPADPMSDLANQTSLDEFAAGMIRDHSLFVRNNQVNLLACAGDSDEPTESDLEVAIQRIRAASFLGVVDCFEQSAEAGAEALRCAFPELDCARPAVNVSTGMKGTVASRTEKLAGIAELRRITELDRQLVDHARAEIHRRPPLLRGKRAGNRVGCLRAWKEMLSVFDAGFYLSKNPDVRQAGANPLVHYLRHGIKEDRKPNRLFDPRYYRKTSKQSPENPLLDFLQSGAAAANPHPLFDCNAYIEANPEVAVNNLNPLAHYLRQARPKAEGHLEINFEINDVQVTNEPQQQPFLQSVNPAQLRAQAPR